LLVQSYIFPHNNKYFVSIIHHTFFNSLTLKQKKICYRIMMQLCMTHNFPKLARKTLLHMRKHQINISPITYSYYNKAILETSNWPTLQQDRWANLRFTWLVLCAFKQNLAIKAEKEQLERIRLQQQQSSSKNRNDSSEFTSDSDDYDDEEEREEEEEEDEEDEEEEEVDEKGEDYENSHNKNNISKSESPEPMMRQNLNNSRSFHSPIAKMFDNKQDEQRIRSKTSSVQMLSPLFTNSTKAVSSLFRRVSTFSPINNNVTSKLLMAGKKMSGGGGGEEKNKSAAADVVDDLDLESLSNEEYANHLGWSWWGLGQKNFQPIDEATRKEILVDIEITSCN
jgi:hypothetical protein